MRTLTSIGTKIRAKGVRRVGLARKLVPMLVHPLLMREPVAGGELPRRVEARATADAD